MEQSQNSQSDRDLAEAATILVVEDDANLRSTLRYNLAGAGYHVLTAADGEEAISIANAERDKLNLVMLDLMLPGVNGLAVLRHIRSFSKVPVIILSARGEEQDRIDGLELGADDYVVKPFALRELMARVRAAARRSAVPGARPTAKLTRGDLVIEPDRHRALVNGKELLLRPKEFGLLLELALEPGRVLSRHDLLERVWGQEIFVEERTVDVHVSWLRGKLNAAGVTGMSIRTIYGTGYRLDIFEPIAEREVSFNENSPASAGSDIEGK